MPEYLPEGQECFDEAYISSEIGKYTIEALVMNNYVDFEDLETPMRSNIV